MTPRTCVHFTWHTPGTRGARRTAATLGNTTVCFLGRENAVETNNRNVPCKLCPNLGPGRQKRARPLPSGWGNAVSVPTSLAVPSPALWPRSVASNAVTGSQISDESRFPHWKDRGSYRLCGPLPASYSPIVAHSLPPTPQFPARVEDTDPKTLGGKTGSAPSCHPHALPMPQAWHLPRAPWASGP